MPESLPGDALLGEKLPFVLIEPIGQMLLLEAGSPITPRLRSLLDRPGIVLRLQCHLEVLEGKSAGEKILLEQDSLTIGRDPECRLRPESEEVAGVQCLLQKSDRAVVLADRGGPGASLLNGEPVQKEIELKNGDQIRVGEILLGVELNANILAQGPADEQALNEWVLAEPFANKGAGDPGRSSTIPVTESQRIMIQEKMKNLNRNH